MDREIIMFLLTNIKQMNIYPLVESGNLLIIGFRFSLVVLL